MDRSIKIYEALRANDSVEFTELTTEGVKLLLGGYKTTITYVADPAQYVLELSVVGSGSEILSAYRFDLLLKDGLLPALQSHLDELREEKEKQKELLEVESKIEAVERVYYFLSINFYSHPDFFWEILDELEVPDYLEKISEASNWIVNNNYSDFLNIYQENKMNFRDL